MRNIIVLFSQCGSQQQGNTFHRVFEKHCKSNAVDETDDMLRNDCEDNGSGDCEEDEGTDCENRDSDTVC
jgi:hypothetical protein